MASSLSPLTATPLPKDHVSVIGAGIVGVSTALYLRLAGVPVTLFDKDAPGHGCSSGNAGMLGVDSCVPVALPGTPAKIPAMLRSTGGPLGVHLRDSLGMAPWFARFALASSPRRVEAIARALNSLQRHLKSAYDTLLEAADATDLVRHAGKIHLCETEAVFAETAYARELQRANGVDFSIIGPAEIAQLAPALTREMARGTFYPNAIHSIHPLTMIERFVETFVRLGGTVVRDEIRDLDIGPDGPSHLLGAGTSYPVDRLVLSAGIGSGPLARRLGLKVPMIAHRGYNLTLPVPPEVLRLPVKSEDRKILLTPMRTGSGHGHREIGTRTGRRTPGCMSASCACPGPPAGMRVEPVEPWIGSGPARRTRSGHRASSRFSRAVFAFGLAIWASAPAPSRRVVSGFDERQAVVRSGAVPGRPLSHRASFARPGGGEQPHASARADPDRSRPFLASRSHVRRGPR
jgi:D-amino-acid dehydrogenase